MKVLLTTDTIGGVWTYAIELARASAALGVEFHFATMGRPLSPSQRRQVAALSNVTIHASSYKLEWMSDCWPDVRAAGDWLLKLERQTAADVVHLNGYIHGALPFRNPKLVVGHSCVLSWWQAVRNEPAPEGWSRYRTDVAAGLRDADVVVAPTHTMLEALKHHYGPMLRGRTIHNGRDPGYFTPGRGKEPFVLAAGRLWDHAKNIAALNDVAPKLAWPVCVAGEAAAPDGTETRCAPHLRLLGMQDEASMADLLSRASIYCLPARYEPFGLSILEAAMCGCALVVGDIPSLREIWQNAALYVDPEDPQHLGRVLQQLTADPAACRSWGAAASQWSQHFTSSAMAAGYVALYRELVEKSAAPYSRAAGDCALTTLSVGIRWPA